MKFLIWLKNILHVHSFNKPIVSQYISFNSRKIIFECPCRKRNVENVHKNFSSPFPIQTAILISNKEMNEILNGADVPNWRIKP